MFFQRILVIFFPDDKYINSLLKQLLEGKTHFKHEKMGLYMDAAP